MKNSRVWIRIKDIESVYGIKRSFLYKKISLGEIVSKLISSRVRLVSVSSLEEFINSSK